MKGVFNYYTIQLKLEELHELLFICLSNKLVSCLSGHLIFISTLYLMFICSFDVHLFIWCSSVYPLPPVVPLYLFCSYHSYSHLDGLKIKADTI